MSSDNLPDDGNFEVEHCDLCIVGTGIAGLNALFVASEYLAREHKVIVVDRNPRPGGMWNETYDYVRLHQPHPMFTAGNIPWTIGKPPWYLATQSEILQHFEKCLDALRGKLSIVERYGYAYQSHCETTTDNAHEVRIDFSATAPGARALQIRTPRLIKAFGFRVPKNDALEFSSPHVQSISPHGDKLLGAAMRASDKPIYVIGGGKTGMDTAFELITRFPRRAVQLVVGKGTIFLNRNKAFPTGLRRWWGGTTGLELALDVALMFDGENEAEVLDHFRRHHSINLDERFSHYVFGLLSEEENAVIAGGVKEIISDYVEDIVDVRGQPTMRLRSGASRVIERDSWIVNCTGYVMREPHAYEPYASPSGAVLSIQPTSGIHILTTFGSYFLTHLYFLGRLGEVPLYELNHQALVEQDKAVFPFACMTQILLNLMLITDAVPMKVISDCGLDFDRWYPLLRRLYGIIRLNRNKPRYIEQCRHALDRVRERYAINCGVLETVRARRAPSQVSQAE